MHVGTVYDMHVGTVCDDIKVKHLAFDHSITYKAP